MNSFYRPLLRRRGLTLVEVSIASTISAIAMFGLISTYVMVSRFTAQGFAETRLIDQATQTMAKMTRRLNHAYTLDSEVNAYHYTIAENRSTISFTVPGTGGGAAQQWRYRLDGNDNELFVERLIGGQWVSTTGGPELTDVDDFLIDNQEGLLSMVLTLETDMARNGTKRFTLVGRALPRNR